MSLHILANNVHPVQQGKALKAWNPPCRQSSSRSFADGPWLSPEHREHREHRSKPRVESFASLTLWASKLSKLIGWLDGSGESTQILQTVKDILSENEWQGPAETHSCKTGAGSDGRMKKNVNAIAQCEFQVWFNSEILGLEVQIRCKTWWRCCYLHIFASNQTACWIESATWIKGDETRINWCTETP